MSGVDNMLLVAADFLEEHGDDRCEILRWMAKGGEVKIVRPVTFGRVEVPLYNVGGVSGVLPQLNYHDTVIKTEDTIGPAMNSNAYLREDGTVTAVQTGPRIGRFISNPDPEGYIRVRVDID